MDKTLVAMTRLMALLDLPWMGLTQHTHLTAVEADSILYFEYLMQPHYLKCTAAMTVGTVLLIKHQ
jgi:hypothetical protein